MKACKTFSILTSILLFSSSAGAVVVNVDFDPEAALSSELHSGDDGVLSSTGGTVWNHGTSSTADLTDEFGGATPFDLDLGSLTFGREDSLAFNDLQDWGIASAFSISDLVEDASYDVAVYGGQNVGFSPPDNSTSFVFCGGLPTYSLPGIEGQDYCVFEDVTATGGAISIEGIDGLVTGIQISGPLPSTEVSGPATIPVLALGLLLTGLLRRRKLPAEG